MDGEMGGGLVGDTMASVVTKPETVFQLGIPYTAWSEPLVSFQCQALPDENKKIHTGLRIEMNFRHSKIRLVP